MTENEFVCALRADVRRKLRRWRWIAGVYLCISIGGDLAMVWAAHHFGAESAITLVAGR